MQTCLRRLRMLCEAVAHCFSVPEKSLTTIRTLKDTLQLRWIFSALSSRLCGTRQVTHVESKPEYHRLNDGLRFSVKPI